VPSVLERWLLCTGNSDDKQRLAPDLSFAVELKVFFLKNPWLSTGQTNKSLTACMEPSLERSLPPSCAQSASSAVHHCSSVLLGPNLTLTPLPPRRTTATDDNHHRTDRHQEYYISRWNCWSHPATPTTS
jgi:hypothetical protein